MKITELKIVWDKAIRDVLSAKIDSEKIYVLAEQTYDSIRRIEIYKVYKTKAEKAAKNKFSLLTTFTPFILAQRPDITLQDRYWVLYLATYFGKSSKSKWELFKRAAFNGDNFICFNSILQDPQLYFSYLSSFDFFENCSYSNHRKFTPKNLAKENGLFKSMRYFIDNIGTFAVDYKREFHELYLLSQKIPSFARLAAFDYATTLVKCGLNIGEPKSMYVSGSTGPLRGLKLMLELSQNDTANTSPYRLSENLMEWFTKHTNIFMAAQVLEDAICNWQKNPARYIKYFG